MTPAEKLRAAKALIEFLDIVEDFGRMTGGDFRRKYPDCDAFAGYEYVRKKGAAVRHKAIALAEAAQ